jgi:hypothetical protein
MNVSEFNCCVDTIDQEALGVLDIAYKEYNNNSDVLDIFKTIADLMRKNPRLQGILPQDISMIFKLKHTISLIRDNTQRDSVSGRVVDDMNYTRLWYAGYLENKGTRE